MGCCSSGEKERVEQPSARGETNSVKSYASAGGRSGVSEERKSGSDLRSLPPRESRILTYRVSADSDEGSPSEIWPIMPPDIAYNPYMSPSMRSTTLYIYIYIYIYRLWTYSREMPYLQHGVHRACPCLNSTLSDIQFM